MKKKIGLVIPLFLAFVVACKGTNEITISADNKQEEQFVPIEEESLTNILIKKTTLINKVVFYEETKLDKGVKEYYLEYISDKKLPMVLFLFKVDLKEKNVTLRPLTPNGKLTFDMQTIPDMIATNTFEGYKTIAAINSDFFDMSTGEPRGITVIDGVALKSTTAVSRAYFGITKTGNPIIGNMKAFPDQRNMILNSLGGYHRLIEDNKQVSQTDVSVHPRTAVGYTNSKEVYLLVVDGRSPEYSNGLMLKELAEIFQALEVKDAVNLDGGGSSTFVTLNNANITVKNRPSDGKPRKVANGWAICIKK